MGDYDFSSKKCAYCRQTPRDKGFVICEPCYIISIEKNVKRMATGRFLCSRCHVESVTVPTDLFNGCWLCSECLKEVG